MAVVDLNAPFAAQGAEDNNSKKRMIYTADDGVTKYIVNKTENFGELLGFEDVTAATPTTPQLPREFKMRKITYSDATGNVSGSLEVGSPSAPIYIEGGSVTIPRKGKAAGLICTVTGRQGEKQTFGGSFDTGQLSGDVT